MLDVDHGRPRRAGGPRRWSGSSACCGRASGVVGSLEHALNATWQVKGRGLEGQARSGLAWLVGAGVLFLGSLSLGARCSTSLPGPAVVPTVIVGLGARHRPVPVDVPGAHQRDVGWRASCPAPSRAASASRCSSWSAASTCPGPVSLVVGAVRLARRRVRHPGLAGVRRPPGRLRLGLQRGALRAEPRHGDGRDRGAAHRGRGAAGGDRGGAVAESAPGEGSRCRGGEDVQATRAPETAHDRRRCAGGDVDPTACDRSEATGGGAGDRRWSGQPEPTWPRAVAPGGGRRPPPSARDCHTPCVPWLRAPRGRAPPPTAARRCLALRAAVAAAKGGDPLAPVTVVVPSNHVGVTARRAAGRGCAGRRARPGAGVAASRSSPPTGWPSCSGRPAWPRPAGGRCRRRCSPPPCGGRCAADPGMFAPVAEHPATEAALVAAYAELSDALDGGLASSPGRGRRGRTTSCACAASARGLLRERLVRRGRPDRRGRRRRGQGDAGRVRPPSWATSSSTSRRTCSAARPRCCAAVADRCPTTVVAGLTGARRRRRRRPPLAAPPRASAPPRTGLSRRRCRSPPGATHASLTASDADDEVRAAVRARGRRRPRRHPARAHRHAVRGRRALRPPGPRAPGGRRRAPQRRRRPPAGRQRWSAARCSTCWPCPTTASAGPTCWACWPAAPGGRPPGPRRPSGSACPARPAWWPGRADWDRLLDRLARQQLEPTSRATADGAASPTPTAGDEARPTRPRRRSDARARPCRAQRRARSAAGCATRVRRARRRLDRGRGRAPPRGPSGCRGCARLADRPHRRRRPAARLAGRRAAGGRRVDAALDRLAALDAVDGPPDARRLPAHARARARRRPRAGRPLRRGRARRAAVVRRRPRPRPGRRPRHGRGHAARRRVRDDSLLPDGERRRAGGELPLRRERVGRDHRRLLGRAGRRRRATCCALPRGDLRASSERVPSRWLVDAAARWPARRLAADGSSGLDAPWLEHVPSFAARRARTAPFPATEQEYRLRGRRAAAGRRPGRRRPGAPTSCAARRSRALHPLRRQPRRRRRARRRVDRASCRPPGSRRGPRARTPTSSSTCSASSPVEDPERQLADHRRSTGDRSSTRCSSAFVAEVLARPPERSPGPTSRGPTTTAPCCRRIAEEVCDELRGPGLTGRPRVLAARPGPDPRRPRPVPRRGRRAPASRRTPAGRRRARVRPAPVDEPCGDAAADGRTLRFRGTADRVDRRRRRHARRRSTTRPAAPTSYSGLTADDPDERRHPPAARRLRPGGPGRAPAGPTPPVRAEYWFVVRPASGFARIGYAVDDAGARPGRGRRSAPSSTASSAASFPAHPTEPASGPCVDCRYCDPDGLGVAELPPRAGSASATTRRSPPTPSWPSRSADAETAASTPDPRPAARPGAPRPHRARPRRDAVRRGRRRVGQDPSPGRPGRRPRRRPACRLDAHRRHHLHREGGRRAARPGPRPRSSERDAGATASDGGRAAGGARRARRRRHRHPARASPSGSSPSTRSRPACRRGSRCSTRSPRRSPSTTAGPRFVDELLDDPAHRAAAAAAARRPASSSTHLRARRRWPSTTTGTWSSRPGRRRAARRRPCSTSSRARSPTLDDVLPRGRRTAPTTTTCCCAHLDGSSAVGADRLRDAADERHAARRCSARADQARGQRQRGARRNWPGVTTAERCGRSSTDARRPAASCCASAVARGASCSALAGRAAPRSRSRRAERAARAPASSSSTTCWCWPAHVLRDPGTAPRCAPRCTTRYQRLLLDEFQDTDPIQVELAVLIAADDPTPPATPWQEVDPEPGPAVLRRRPQAVDLPVPPGRHRRCSCGRATRFGGDEPRRAHHQLPHRRAGRRLGQPRVRPAHPADGAGASQPALRAARRRARPAPPVGPAGRRARRRAPTSDGPAPTTLRRREAADVAAADQPRRWPRAGRSADGRRRPPSWRRPGRRHRHPAAGPHVAAVPGGRARRGAASPTGPSGSLVYGTPGGPRPAADAAGRRRPDRRAAPWSPPCARRCSAAATTTCSAGRQRTAAAATTSAPLPDGVPADHPVAAGLDLPRRAAPRAPLAVARASCSTGSSRDRRLLELGVAERPAPRPVAAAAVRASTRPGPGPRPTARHAAPVPRWVAPAARRGRPGGRGGAARDRRRRRAHHDRPRAPRAWSSRSSIVSGPVDRSRSAGARGAEVRLAARRRPCGHQARPQGRRRRRSSALAAARRADGRTTSACACSTSPAPGPATTSSCRCTASRARDAGTTDADAQRRGAARAGARRPRWSTRRRWRRRPRGRRPAGRRADADDARRRLPERGRRRRRPAAARRVAPPAATRRWPPAAAARTVAATALTDDGRPDAADDPGLAQAARATSTCRRGRRAATARPSAGPSTACCRPSTWPPATGSPTRSRPRPRPRA